MSQIINPLMVALARKARGLTQKELAEALGLDQYIVSRIEKGQYLKLDEKLDFLVRVLRYPKEFFYQTFQVYPAGMHFYRKHKTLSAKELERIEALMNIYREHAKTLLTAVDIDYKEIKYCDLEEYETPQNIAMAFRQYLNLPRGPINNMTNIIENLGIIIIPYKFSNRKFSGASILANNPNYILVINSDMPGDRYRYTLAHELAHIIMHNLPRPNMEEEADQFSSEFLMPACDIAPYLENLTLDKLASLKTYWKVSMAAILKRSVDLNKITERHYRKLWEEMGKCGYKLQEPKEFEIPAEQPSLLKEVLTFHTEELRYTPEQLSQMLTLHPQEFFELYKISNKSLRLVTNKPQSYIA